MDGDARKYRREARKQRRRARQEQSGRSRDKSTPPIHKALSTSEYIKRQSDEIEALEATFGGSFLDGSEVTSSQGAERVSAPAPRRLLHAMRTIGTDPDAALAAFASSELSSYRLTMSLCDNSSGVTTRSVRMVADIPLAYPEAGASLMLIGKGVDEEALAALRAKAWETSLEVRGGVLQQPGAPASGSAAGPGAATPCVSIGLEDGWVRVPPAQGAVGRADGDGKGTCKGIASGETGSGVEGAKATSATSGDATSTAAAGASGSSWSSQLLCQSAQEHVLAAAQAVREAALEAWASEGEGAGSASGSARGPQVAVSDGEGSPLSARARPTAAAAGSTSTSTSTSTSASTSTGEEMVECPSIHKGPSLIDRKSEFVGFAARVTSEAEVRAVLARLLEDKRVAKATHNMLAFRFRRRTEGGEVADPLVVVSDNDEDGESGAGARMSSLLELAGAQDACVVVTRWYGGVLLGPKRFAHISNTARAALQAAGIVGGGEGAGGAASGGAGKRGK